MVKITGSFEYNSDDRSLVFTFDEESKKYVSENGLTGITVEPQVDKAGALFCRDGEGNETPSFESLHLVFHQGINPKGLLVMAFESQSKKAYQALMSNISSGSP